MVSAQNGHFWFPALRVPNWLGMEPTKSETSESMSLTNPETPPMTPVTGRTKNGVSSPPAAAPAFFMSTISITSF
jgi:hypothetical protein